MRVKVFVYDRYKGSLDWFETILNDWIKSTGDVALTSVAENTRNGDIVFTFEHGDKKSVDQELCLMASAKLDVLEGAVNAAITGLDESGRKARYINFITTCKSVRALVVFVVEGSGSRISDNVREREGIEEKKQDPDTNGKPKQRRQRGIRS